MHVPGKEVHQYVPDALSGVCDNNLSSQGSRGIFLACSPFSMFPMLSGVHNSAVGHHGLQMCKK